MADYTIIKDTDVTIVETIQPLENITGATINWMLVYQTEDFSGDLDAIAPIFSKAVGSGIVITDGPNGEFTVAIDDGDTEDLTPGNYIVLARVRTAGLVLLAIGGYEVFLSA